MTLKIENQQIIFRKLRNNKNPQILFDLSTSNFMEELDKMVGISEQVSNNKLTNKISSVSEYENRKGCIRNQKMTGSFNTIIPLNTRIRRTPDGASGREPVRRGTFCGIIKYYLSNKAQQRMPEMVKAAAKICRQQKLFPEVGNSLQILNLICAAAKIQEFKENEPIYAKNDRSNIFYKMFEGVVELCSQTSRNSQNSKLLSEKGEFLESFGSFNEIKNKSARALSNTFLIAIPFDIYAQNIALFQHQKVVLRVLNNTSIFQSFSLRDIQYLIQVCPEIKLCQRQILFKQGKSVVSLLEDKKEDPTNGYYQISVEHKIMYYVVQGEISITKSLKNKDYHICTVKEGNFIGDQAIFLQQISHRQYKATVSTLEAKVIPISHKNIQDWIKIRTLGINYQLFVNKFKNSVREKLAHYQNFLYQSQAIKSSVFARQATQCLSKDKRQKLKNISNVSRNISSKVEGMQKIKAKRMNFQSFSEQVSFQQPLFTRKDFPQIESYLKRFQTEERRALQTLTRNRSLHLRHNS